MDPNDFEEMLFSWPSSQASGDNPQDYDTQDDVLYDPSDSEPTWDLLGSASPTPALTEEGSGELLMVDSEAAVVHAIHQHESNDASHVTKDRYSRGSF